MAHFARIDDGTVREVIVVNNDVILDTDGNESEAIGQEFIASIGLPGDWVQTSYNGTTRGVYAGVGYSWDGKEFTALDPGPDPVAAAYERGKADGAAELLAMQATVTEAS